MLIQSLLSFFKSQKGYGGTSMFLWALLVGLAMYYFMFPDKFNPQPATGCFVGDPVYRREILQLPAVKQPTSEDDAAAAAAAARNEEFFFNGGPDKTVSHEFALIRKNVPIPNESKPPWWRFFGPDTPTANFHTMNTGENPKKPGYDLYYPAAGGEVDLKGLGRTSLITEQLVFFVKKDPNTVIRTGDKTIYIADVYQDIEVLDNPLKQYTTDELFRCLPDQELEGFHMVDVPQNISEYKKELQLGWFLFALNNYWGVHCKPAIYLYPEEETKINVQVEIPNGTFLYTDPLYPSNGWNVRAKPNGDLHYLGEISKDSKGKTNYANSVFPYLYYEARIHDSAIQKPTKGFIKKYEDLAMYYDELLPKLGLNKKESDEFKKYWVSALPYSPYYFIGVVSPDNLNTIEPLTITPKQDTTIRVSLYFEALKHFKVVTPPTITTPQRIGFTVVEWGGMLKADKNHPFTCIQ